MCHLQRDEKKMEEKEHRITRLGQEKVEKGKDE